MTEKPMMMPVRVSEILGYSHKSKNIDTKNPTSERKPMQPMRLKDLLHSCPRSDDRPPKRTFEVSDQNVRRQLYGSSPKQIARKSNFPGIIFDKKTKPQQTTTVKPQTQAKTFRPSILPPKSSNKSTNAKKSLLVQPNSISMKSVGSTVVKRQGEKLITGRFGKGISPVLELSETSETSLTMDALKPLEETPSRPVINNITEKNQEDDSDKENQSRPTVIKCIVYERLRKLEKDVEEIKENQKIEKELLDKIYKLLCLDNEAKIKKEKNSIDKTTSTIKTPVIKTPVTPPSLDNTEKKGDNTSIAQTPNEINKENINSSGKRRRRSKNSGKCRRSLRLANKKDSMGRDSFSQLEQQLNIESSKQEVSKSVIDPKTPVREKMKIQSKSDKPLREYLAMKASMNFLETPDVTRFKSFIEPSDDTPLKQKRLRRSISSKLFTELQELYHDSPESNPS